MNNWKEVENIILNEVNFLKNNLLLSPYRQNDPIKCNHCLLRNIATMVVAGNVSLIKNTHNKQYWGNNSVAIDSKKHGSEWHDNKIRIIKKYFNDNNLQTVNEPKLHYGRADIGVPELNLFIEIGTINLYKLHYNLKFILNSRILLIPDDNYFLEFIL